MSPKIIVLRWKGDFNRRFPTHALCLGRVFCFRVQVFDLACARCQDVYDRRAARRLRRARKQFARRRTNALRAMESGMIVVTRWEDVRNGVSPYKPPAGTKVYVKDINAVKVYNGQEWRDDWSDVTGGRY